MRFAVIGLAALAAVGGMAALAIQFGIHLTNEWQHYSPLPTMQPPRKGDKVIVFAPHSDDETLGCGGMLALAARGGARVRVVLVTNGDGFRVSMARTFATVRITPTMAVAYAYRRQKETLAALSTLGVNASDVTFLGYPDRGIAALWDRCWGIDQLYTSNTTRTSHSPYHDSYRYNAPYCGESLLSDIERVITTNRPTDVYIPHPCDNHSDHYATYCFVTAAIEQLRSEANPLAESIRVHTYLVHRGDWPTPKGDHIAEPLAPPHSLAQGSTEWRSLPIPPDVVELKREAIRQYKSQTAIEKGFLSSFARANEVFGDLPVRRVARAANGTMSVDGDPEDWWGKPPAVVDPVGDYVVAGMNKGGDVRAIYVCRDSNSLYVRLDCVRHLSKRITYSVDLRGVGTSDSDDYYSVLIHPPGRCSRPGVAWAYKGNTLELAVPLREFHPRDNLYVRASTKLVKLTIDNTGWHALEIGEPAGTGPQRSAKPGSQVAHHGTSRS